MAVWLIRAGGHGEFEPKFVGEKRVYVTWERLDVDLSAVPSAAALVEILSDRYPDSKRNKLRNWASQIWPFAHSITKGDLVVLPSKLQPAIYIGEVIGDYQFERNGPSPFFHWR